MKSQKINFRMPAPAQPSRGKHPPNRIQNPLRAGLGFGILSFGILGFGILSACIAPPLMTPPPASPAGITPTPTSVLANSTPVPAASPDAAGQRLRLWLPPRFAPSADTPDGKVLLAQLASFQAATGWQVDVRVKKTTGQGSLLDALHTSLLVAPGISPDVIALDNSMLPLVESLQPLTQITPGEVADFYPFALQSVRRNETLIALPFAADAMGFAYSTTAYPVPPQTWKDLNPESGPAWLPLNDPAALVTLQQYIALGGKLLDEDDAPNLDATLLTQILSDYQWMQTEGLLLPGSFTSASIDESWATYRENRTNAAAALFSNYVVDRRRVSATNFTLLPTHTGARATFVRQWNYALIAVDPTRQAAAVELMRWLTAPDNLGTWTFRASVLPPRANALGAWNDSALATLAEQLLGAAQPEPQPGVTAIIGPPITAAVQSVLNGQASPQAAAATAAAAVNGK